MSINSSNTDQLNGLIRYLNYHGPVFIRLNSDLEPPLQQAVSIAATQDIA